MPLDAGTKTFLELQIFKGKIVDTKEGRGGRIYIVEREGFPQFIAYKTIKEFEDMPHTGDMADVTERLEREANHWFRFAGHPLVIKPRSITMIDGFPLICMPYCDGDVSALTQNTFSLTGVVCLALQIVKGMLAAKAQGMKHHQDMKPENLLFCDLSKEFSEFPSPDVDPALKYSIRVADFGVANAWDNAHRGGTNVYKAPEQHEGTSYSTFEPDVFAVGIVITELLQGYHPAVTGPLSKPLNWNGSKMKKWAISGQRNFVAAADAETQELIDLLQEMLQPDPASRPTFDVCFERLVSLLKKLSLASYLQLNVLFQYYDYISTYCQLEDEIHRLLNVARIPAQRVKVVEEISLAIEQTLALPSLSLEQVITLHHLTRGLYRLRDNPIRQVDQALLVTAARTILSFVLSNAEKIKAVHLFPKFNFPNPPVKQTSDIEARAELFSANIEILSSLNSLDESLQQEIQQAGTSIEAVLLFNDALTKWVGHKVPEACALLDRVRQLVPKEAELDALYEHWRGTPEWPFVAPLNNA
jgi:serine/threonine protein kinase